MKKIVRLLKNKPAMAALTTAIVAVSARLGWGIDAEFVGVIVGAGVAVAIVLVMVECKKLKNIVSGEVIQ